MRNIILLLLAAITFTNCEDTPDILVMVDPIDYSVEGKWLWSPSENRIDANTMYEYVDGIIHTYYGDYPTDTYWNSLDSSDRITDTGSYTYDGYTLIIDGTQHIISFECDGGKMLFDNGVQYWRLSSNLSKNVLKKASFCPFNILGSKEKIATNILVLSRAESLEQVKTNGKRYVKGANLEVNEYGTPLFADFFFFITGFHGFHVLSGVVINIIIFFNVIIGTYERRKNYEMVEKVGLYWHFVDLVWVFVFTFFYLV